MRVREGESFASLWSYLCDVASSANTAEPLAIHSQSGDRDGWGHPRTKLGHDGMLGSGDVIRGLPFSRTFLRRVDHVLPPALQDALQTLKPLGTDIAPVRAVRRSQWRVVASVLRDGMTDTEACRSRLGMSSWQFQIAAEGGIRALRSALDRSA